MIDSKTKDKIFRQNLTRRHMTGQQAHEGVISIINVREIKT